MKDECGGEQILEVVGLRAKMYYTGSMKRKRTMQRVSKRM